LPIISNAVITHADKDNVEIGKTDLESYNSVMSRTIQGEYPDYNKVFPTGQKCQKIQVNAEYLYSLLAFFKDFVDNHSKIITLEIPIKNDMPIQITAERQESKQTAIALLMPVKSD